MNYDEYRKDYKTFLAVQTGILMHEQTKDVDKVKDFWKQYNVPEDVVIRVLTSPNKRRWQ